MNNNKWEKKEKHTIDGPSRIYNEDAKGGYQCWGYDDPIQGMLPDINRTTTTHSFLSIVDTTTCSPYIFKGEIVERGDVGTIVTVAERRVSAAPRWRNIGVRSSWSNLNNLPSPFCSIFFFLELSQDFFLFHDNRVNNFERIRCSNSRESRVERIEGVILFCPSWSSIYQSRPRMTFSSLHNVHWHAES